MEVVEFTKNKDLFNKNLSTGIEFSSEANPEFLLALAKNTPLQNANLDFPLILGNGQLTATGNKKKFQFKGNSELVVQGGLEASMRFGIFTEVSQLSEDLIQTDKLQLSLEVQKDQFYVLFSTSYELGGEAQGKWILNGGSLNASLSGTKSGRLNVIKVIKPGTGLKDAIKATLSEFKLPKHIKTPEDISPGTYLITESYGAVKASFGAQVGYDFNWLFESELQGLEGTVGLRAKLGAQLGIGFDDAGQYALMLSRRDRKTKVRLQLFKQRKNGRSFALALAASVKANLDDFRDTSLDELIKATLGIHHAQILEDLKGIRKWTDVDKLEDNLLGLSEGLVKELVDATGETFEKARKKLLDLLKAWEKLEQDAAAVLWQILDDKLAGNGEFKPSELVADFQEIANKDKEEIQDFLKEKLSRVGYEKTAFGKLLNAILPAEDIIAAITDSGLFKKLQKEAKNMADVLSLEEKISHFHSKLSEELQLKRVKEAVQTANLEDLGPMLSSKLFELITENGQFVLEKLEEIDQFIDKIRENSEVIFEKTKEALQKEYGISFALSLQRQKENQALIDASFKLGSSKIGKVFKAALQGNFDALLVGDHGDAISLNEATLTHSLEKSKSISLSLPFIERDFSKINKAISSGKFIQEADGKLLMYELVAEDTIRRSKKLSQLAIEGLYSVKNSEGVFNPKNRSLYLSYNFRLAKKRFKTKHLEQLIEPFFKMYLPDAFSNNLQQPKISTDLWIRQLDDQIDAINHNGKNNFGTNHAEFGSSGASRSWRGMV